MVLSAKNYLIFSQEQIPISLILKFFWVFFQCKILSTASQIQQMIVRLSGGRVSKKLSDFLLGGSRLRRPIPAILKFTIFFTFFSHCKISIFHAFNCKCIYRTIPFHTALCSEPKCDSKSMKEIRILLKCNRRVKIF